MNSKDLARRQAQAIEQWSLETMASVMDSFAARVRDQARRGGYQADAMAALLAVAGSAEEVAGEIRNEGQRRQSPPPIQITIRDRDGRPT